MIMGEQLHTVSKIDTRHLVSYEQIEVVRASVIKGDTINFQRGEDEITGIVDKVYDNIFLLEDGRCFTWIDYILGSPITLQYLRAFHPIKYVRDDKEPNCYAWRQPKTTKRR